MKDGLIPNATNGQAQKNRSTPARGKAVTAEQIDRIGELHDDQIHVVLNTPLNKPLRIQELDNCPFHSNDHYLGSGPTKYDEMAR